MDPKRWLQIDSLLEEALDRAPEQRAAFLEEACAGDEDLRREVEVLLAAHEEAGSFGETPALDLAARKMADQPSRSLVGRRLGPYEILSLLGRGGMGEVYRARDTRLDRIDALKILPVEVAADLDRSRRFIREAKAASALNHPNIATIYEIGESEGIHWIAMELVEGETLAERLKGKALEATEILDISIQVCEALEKAHSKGIVHRDIKPANLMLTPEGQSKVLDFGLAKITRPEGPAATATVSTETRTVPGMVMGTARYMSPEQVLGQPVDHRTDIFSLGAVLYEMAMGQPPFAGETASAIFDAIVHEKPSWPPRVRATVPEELHRIIQKSLEKFREMRYQSATDLCADLKHLKHDLAAKLSITQPAAVAGPSQPVQAIVSRKNRWILALAGLLALTLAVIAALWFAKMSRPETPLTPVPLTSYPGTEEGASFSPDGSQVAFAWNGEKEDNWDIYVKLIGSDSHLRLTSNPAADQWPAWSPDGRHIAFMRWLSESRVAVVLVSQLGGPERILTEHDLSYVSRNSDIIGPLLSWSPDGRAIAMVGQENRDARPSLFLYKLETGEKQDLTKPIPVGFQADSCPAFSSDGRTLAFFRWVEWGNSDLYLLDLSAELKPFGEPRRLTFGKWRASSPAWVMDGSGLVFSAGTSLLNNSLWRVDRSDSSELQRLAATGEYCYYPAISRRGNRLAYTHATNDYNIWHMEIPSPNGKANPPTKLISSTRLDWVPEYSPDGKKIAFNSDRSGSLEIWVCDADGSNTTQLTYFGKTGCGMQSWSPDGNRLTLTSGIEGHSEVYVINASGGAPRRLTFSSRSANSSWSHDGRWIYFDSERGIQKVPAEGGSVVPVNNTSVWLPRESPDGKFIYACRTTPEGNDLVRTPVGGGEAKQIFGARLGVTGWVLVDNGVYFLCRADPAKGYSIRFLELATGKVKTIAELGKQFCEDLSVSPDRRWILYTQHDQVGSDLMLVENFR